MINVDAINDDPALRGTPLGDLSVVDMGDWVGVMLDDGISPPRIIHTVDEQGVFNALAGKAFWEDRKIREMYAGLAERRESSAAREAALQSADFRRALQRWLQRDDARDVLLAGKR